MLLADCSSPSTNLVDSSVPAQEIARKRPSSVDEVGIAVEGLGLPLPAGPTNKQKGSSHCGAWASLDDTREIELWRKGAMGHKASPLKEMGRRVQTDIPVPYPSPNM
jgi:hypothetical protein